MTSIQTWCGTGRGDSEEGGVSVHHSRSCQWLHCFWRLGRVWCHTWGSPTYTHLKQNVTVIYYACLHELRVLVSTEASLSDYPGLALHNWVQRDKRSHLPVLQNAIVWLERLSCYAYITRVTYFDNFTSLLFMAFVQKNYLSYMRRTQGKTL